MSARLIVLLTGISGPVYFKCDTVESAEAGIKKITDAMSENTVFVSLSPQSVLRTATIIYAYACTTADTPSPLHEAPSRSLFESVFGTRW